jgi:hypothetical protein
VLAVDLATVSMTRHRRPLAGKATFELVGHSIDPKLR